MLLCACLGCVVQARRLAAPRQLRRLVRCAASEGFDTLAAPASAELEVKKSRFIAFCAPAATPADALAFVAARRDPSARHNCWAYMSAGEARSSDDGEPGGTAGAPILRAITSAGLQNVAVLVVRYFGGILLGTGGLTRAYGGAASAALREGGRERVVPTLHARVACSYADVGVVYAALDAHGAQRTGETHGEGGADLTLSLSVRASAADALAAALADSTAGRARLVTHRPPE